METIAPRASPRPTGVRFISIEDFDASFPAPEIGQPYVQNVPPKLVQPSTSNSTVNSSVAENDKAGSESGGSPTSSTPDLSCMNWIGKLHGI